MQTTHVTAGDRRERRRLTLGVLCFATFLTAINGASIAPFLLEMARDLQTDLASVGNLVAILSVSWGATSLLSGAASDRIGRKPLLLVGLCFLVASPLGVALSGSYGWVAFWRFVGGVGGGTFMGTVFATVSDYFPSHERGRSLGWIMVGQSLSLVLGVPLVTLAASFGGWRGALQAHSAATLVAAVAVWLVLPRVARRQVEQVVPFRSIARLIGPRVLALLAASATERLCYSGMAVFLPTYLTLAYGISLRDLAIGLALIALGNLLGNVLGGQIGDRIPSRPLFFAASLAATALLALPVFLWQPGVAVSIGLGFLYTLANAIGRPALLAALSDVSSEARGAVLGLNITFSSFGWMGSTAIGGILIASGGFSSLGLLTAAFGLVGAALATASALAALRAASR